MRTTVDLPDGLLRQIKPVLRREGLTMRQAIINGLRSTLLTGTSSDYVLPDARFTGPAGFADGFDGDVNAAVRDDTAQRMSGTVDEPSDP